MKRITDSEVLLHFYLGLVKKAHRVAEAAERRMAFLRRCYGVGLPPEKKGPESDKDRGSLDCR